MERLEKEELSPIPENYELWYAFYANMSPEITRAIGILEASKKKITEDHCQELYKRFLSSKKTEDMVRNAGDNLQKTMLDITDLVKTVRDAASEYGETLEGVNLNLNKVENWDDMEGVIKDILDDTHKMIKHNESLENKLDQSTQVIEELNENLETVRREAMTDGLTGLANRKLFDQKINEVIEDSNQTLAPFCLLMIDIDHFKEFNDNFGHQVGDQVLKLVAKTITDNIKGRDLACRYGGEEFAVILPETPLSASVTVANLLRKSVASKEIVNRVTNDSMGRITMSVGAAESVVGETIEELIERADAAMYTAKQNGRNQVAAAPAPTPRKTRQEVS